MADLTTNSQRAREIVGEIPSYWPDSQRERVALRADIVEQIERALNEAEDRGSEAAAMLAASRGPLQVDKATVDALLGTIRESLSVLTSPASEVGLEAAIDARSRNLCQAIIGNFEVRLLPADDVEAPSDEPTEPLRGPAR